MIFAKQIEALYRKQLYTRCDETGDVYYFSAEDFPGLHCDEYAFTSSQGHTLQGYFYYYDAPVEGRLVVFDHGMGGGHSAYMKEIEMLARHGYRVFAYDHTGCMRSGGASTGGFAQSLRDLNDCLNALRADIRYHRSDISVMGHSWGAFSTLNIAALHPEVSHVVAISGFISVEAMLKQNFRGLLAPYAAHMLGVEKQSNPDFADYHAIETLEHTDAHVLLLYSSDDKLVHVDRHFEPLKAALSERPNVRLLLVEGKGHNPNYTADAVRYKDEFFAALTRKRKKKELATDEQKRAFVAAWDWNRMTAQDEGVWQEIFATLDA